ncbi:MAG TPA: HlyD family efflux transporter periplasmic adaptor subunit [Bacillales bacterium]|nr:HlyD family efflux transporter periplasmic adaptor subunit [Bacillales bacterium]
MSIEIEREKVEKKKRVWPKVLAWFGVVLFIAATAGANVYQMRTETEFAPESLKTAVVKGKTMYETMIVSGQVQPADVARFFKDPSRGDVALLVQEGDKVKKGDILFRYEGAQINTQLDSLELQKKRINMQIAHNNSRINELEEQISDVEGQISEAEDQDAPQSIINQLENQKEQLEAQKEDMAFQNDMNDLELEKVNMQIDQAEEQLNGLVVKSEMDGIVRKVAKESFNTQEPLVTVVSAEPYEIHGTLSEYDAVRVKKGQAVTVQAKALGGEEWQGNVAEVGKMPVQQQTARGGQESVASYPFTITVKGKTKALRPGFHVTAEITVDKHENVAAVSFNAIVSHGEKSFVFVVQDGKLDRRLLKTGLVNGEYKEVIKGVKVGDKIVLHPSSDLEEGMVISHDPTK